MGNIVNNVTLVGNLGADPDVIYLDNGRAKAKFSIATNEVWFDRNRQKQTHTEWHKVVAWDKKAELVEKLCRKGTSILIDGKLRTESWKDGEGNSRSEVFVLLDEFRLLGSEASQGE